ncbi:MAG: uroporphyrinogen-III synthase [Rickettsiaceae bacterium]|nr:uroporphyrinogen-III synthase [Rickettsiaceae bacterium]
MKNVLLIRAKEHNKPLVDNLAHMGFNVFEEPMLTYEINEQLCENLKEGFFDYYPVIITSMYAAKVLAQLNLVNLKAFVVGKKSASILENSGVKILSYAQGIEELLLKIGDKISDCIYIRGTHVTKEIVNLKSELILYRTEYREKFSDQLVNLIQTKQIKIVTVFSQKSAEVFLNCAKKSSIHKELSHIEFYCFSARIAEIVTKNKYQARFPNRPDMESFLELFT